MTRQSEGQSDRHTYEDSVRHMNRRTDGQTDKQTEKLTDLLKDIEIVFFFVNSINPKLSI